jgi:hypothetical protein
MITIREQVVPSAVAQSIIVKFETNENVKLAEILNTLISEFGDKTFSRIQVHNCASHLKKAEQRLKTCEDYTGKLWPAIFGKFKASY